MTTTRSPTTVPSLPPLTARCTAHEGLPSPPMPTPALSVSASLSDNTHRQGGATGTGIWRNSALYQQGGRENNLVSVELLPFNITNLLSVCVCVCRALKASRYGSFTNLRLSFKNHYPSSPSSPTNALVVRGIIPGSPASFTTQLQPGGL